jgi:hypothetical protein
MTASLENEMVGNFSPYYTVFSLSLFIGGEDKFRVTESFLFFLSLGIFFFSLLQFIPKKDRERTPNPHTLSSLSFSGCSPKSQGPECLTHARFRLPPL